MQTLICPSCGLERNKNLFIGNICKNCYYKTDAKFDINLKEIILCKSCGRLKSEFFWKAFAEETFEEVIKMNIKANFEYTIKNFDLIFYKNKITAKMEISSGKAKKDCFDYKITFTPKLQFCPECYKKVADFFEALVQLRGFGSGKDTHKTFLKILDKAIKEELRKGNYGAFVQKFELVNNGIDYYLGSKQLAQSFIRGIKDQYNVDKKDSFKLVGLLPGGKDKVRYTYLVRKHEEKKKEEVDFQR